MRRCEWVEVKRDLLEDDGEDEAEVEGGGPDKMREAAGEGGAAGVEQ